MNFLKGKNASGAGKATGGEADTDRVAMPEIKVPIVRTKQQPQKHKVITFGFTVTVEGEVPEMYKFQYPPVADQPEDLHPGVIPAGFSAGVPVDDTMVYFHTREGAMGPEFQVAYTHPDNVLLDWTDDVDALWIESLQTLEDASDASGRPELSEEALNFLDADPLFLFGIADPATQRALEKAATVPMLKCMGTRPCLEEWFSYLNADPELDKDFRWVVESFAEVELPAPWTSYKGVGSIVCYLNNDTNETTWKHPFYDYFAQLLDHCRRASREEHIKLRLNRMLWSYEAESQTDVQNQMPLVSPKYVKQMAEILENDLVAEPYMVRTLKTFLKAFSQQYRLEEELDPQEVKWCLEIVDNERAKVSIARNLPYEEDPSDNINPAAHAQLYCIECGVVATCYCPTCEDCLCEACFERLHAKGNRSTHTANHLIPCCLCRVMPAKLQCTYTFGNYCHECYARKHVKTLPKFLDLKPIRIDYTKPDKRNAADASSNNNPKAVARRVCAIGEVDPQQELMEGFSKRAPIQTTLGEKWHAFYDLRGIKYYYNFETQESMRRPHPVHIDLAPETGGEGGGEGGTGKGKSDEHAKEQAKVLRQLATSKAPRMLKDWTRKPNKDD